MVVVHPPEGEAGGDADERPGAGLFPMLMLETPDRAEADSLAERLRNEGATVALMSTGGGSVVCPRHPPQLLGRHCRNCGVDICAKCRLDADGSRLCPACGRVEKRKTQNRRLRILFSVFLFSVFVYGAVQWQRGEKEHLDFTEGVDVAVFQFVSPADLDHPVVRALNSVDGPYGLGRIADWYTEEYARYTHSSERPIRVHTFGPWSDALVPPTLAEEGAPWWQSAWSASSYVRYWHGLAREHGAEPDDWDARLYVVYGREAGDLAADSRGSNQGRVAVTFVSLDDPNAAYAQLTLAHELGHVFGAADQYDPESFLSVAPEGLAEPLLTPLYPQRYAELMAVDRPVAPDREAEVRSLDDVRVGYQTAGSMRWIEQEQVDTYYRPAPEVLFGPPRPGDADPKSPGPPGVADEPAALPEPR